MRVGTRIDDDSVILLEICLLDPVHEVSLMPVSFLASAISRMPSYPKPWKEYGDVLGLYAPPRRIFPPASSTSLAMRQTCSFPSTEQGPPIMTIGSCPPILIPPMSIIVSSGWNMRLASLYGADTLCTFSTHSLARMSRSSRDAVSPTRPHTLKSSPSISCVY